MVTAIRRIAPTVILFFSQGYSGQMAELFRKENGLVFNLAQAEPSSHSCLNGPTIVVFSEDGLSMELLSQATDEQAAIYFPE